MYIGIYINYSKHKQRNIMQTLNKAYVTSLKYIYFKAYGVEYIECHH